LPLPRLLLNRSDIDANDDTGADIVDDDDDDDNDGDDDAGEPKMLLPPPPPLRLFLLF
jgi:hypothetical protein